MGLFSRKRDRAQGGGDGGEDRRKFGHAAFDPGDLEDARRGHPAVSLQAFATGAGLDFRGVEQPGAFVATLPTWPDYLFNVCRGPLASGRYGMVAHELYEVRAHNGSVQAAGAFHGIRLNTRWQGVEVGGIRQGPVKNEPFWGDAVWIPTTSVHVRVPETNLLPIIRFARSTSYAVQGDNGLDQFGLPGFRTLGPEVGATVLAPIAEACRPWLPTRADAHVELRVRYGVAALTVNGYRSDQDLRHLLSTAEGAAEAVAALAPGGVEEPFDALGPAAASASFRPGVPQPDPRVVPAYAQQAAQWGLHHEDPAFLPMLLPRCPIPGAPSGVLAGTLPGGGPFARVVWFEQGGRTVGSVRGGVIVPANRGAATPVGGQLDPQTEMYTEVVDGVAYAWRKNRSFDALDADALVSAARSTLRSAGLATL